MLHMSTIEKLHHSDVLKIMEDFYDYDYDLHNVDPKFNQWLIYGQPVYFVVEP